MSDDVSKERLVSVRRVVDEAAATMLRDFLRAQGIEAVAAPASMPWLGGIERPLQGYWGHVEVLEHEAERARALIEDFYAAQPEPEPSTEPGPGEEAEEGVEEEAP